VQPGQKSTLLLIERECQNGRKLQKSELILPRSASSVYLADHVSPIRAVVTRIVRVDSLEHHLVAVRADGLALLGFRLLLLRSRRQLLRTSRVGVDRRGLDLGRTRVVPENNNHASVEAKSSQVSRSDPPSDQRRVLRSVYKVETPRPRVQLCHPAFMRERHPAARSSRKYLCRGHHRNRRRLAWVQGRVRDCLGLTTGFGCHTLEFCGTVSGVGGCFVAAESFLGLSLSLASFFCGLGE